MATEKMPHFGGYNISIIPILISTRAGASKLLDPDVFRIFHCKKWPKSTFD